MGLASSLAPALASADSVRLDDFTRTYPPGETYGTWELQKFSPKFGSGADLFFQFVRSSDQEHHLHLRSGRNNSFSLGRKEPFKLQEWPILEWEWNVTRAPPGGDVRVRAKDDQAGAMCVIVNPGLFGFESLCYLWENAGPKDTPITSTKRDNARYLILRTVGEDGVNRWYAERRDALADFTRVFGKPPAHDAVIGMVIDSDDTASAAEAFYRNIYRRAR
jgi:hypothetical protein